MYVGGTVCDIESVSDTKIICTTSAKPQSEKKYPGGRGMRIEGLTAASSEDFNSYDASGMIH